MQKKREIKRYEIPAVEIFDVKVEGGYKDSIFVELPEIDGSKEEGEW